MSGVVGAIGTKADQVMKELKSETMTSFDKVFAELVHLNRNGPPTRKRVALTRFEDDDEAISLIKVLAGSDCRVLVRSTQDEDSNVEVAHEKLFSAWPKLANWIDDGGESLRLIDYAEEAAKRWHETGGHIQELWMDQRVEAIQNAFKRFGKITSSLLEQMLRPHKMLVERLNDNTLTHEDRLEIGKKLATVGDSRPGVGLLQNGLPDIVWIEVPSGQIQLEDIDYIFEVKPFRLAKYVVTNVQFHSFIDEGGYETEEWWKGLKKQDAQQSSWPEPNAPREKVSWYEAIAFCRWLSSRTGSSIRLPTEWEWQQAATGGDSFREYPWSGKWDATYCNWGGNRLRRTIPVGMYPHGSAINGLLDMSGNVSEWCLNSFMRPEGQDLGNSKDSFSQRVLRGGSWVNVAPESLRTKDRYGEYPDNCFNLFGFRLAQDIS